MKSFSVSDNSQECAASFNPTPACPKTSLTMELFQKEQPLLWALVHESNLLSWQEKEAVSKVLFVSWKVVRADFPDLGDLTAKHVVNGLRRVLPIVCSVPSADVKSNLEILVGPAWGRLSKLLHSEPSVVAATYMAFLIEAGAMSGNARLVRYMSKKRLGKDDDTFYSLEVLPDKTYGWVLY